MTRINGITSSPSQALTVADPNTNAPINIALRFQPRTQEWYISLTFGTWSLSNLKLVYHPNELMQYSNVIPFGLMVMTTDQLDPYLVNDFYTGRVTLILLTSTEVAEMTAAILSDEVTG